MGLELFLGSCFYRAEYSRLHIAQRFGAFPLPLNSVGHHCTCVCEGSRVLSQHPNWCNFPWAVAPRNATPSAPALLGKGRGRGCSAGGPRQGTSPAFASSPPQFLLHEMIPVLMFPLSQDIHQPGLLQQGMLVSAWEEPRASSEIPLWNNNTHPIQITTRVSGMPQPLVSPAAVEALGGSQKVPLLLGETRASPHRPCLPAGSTRSRCPFCSTL